MPAEPHVIKFTSNFERSLDEIERFLEDNEATHAFNLLLEELTDAVVPNLERFPRIGRAFLDRPALSLEAQNRIERLRVQLHDIGDDAELREYISTHYLVLYAVIGTSIYLLSIRHHRQLSFDFAYLW